MWPVIRLSVALFAVQAGFHGFTAAMPLVLHRNGVPDPQIGLIMGTAGLVQLGAAFLVAGLIDRFGGRRILLAGGVAHLLALAILVLPGLDPAADALPFFVARTLQGLGLSMALPSALSLVPRLVPATRAGLALSFAGSAQNLTLVVLPLVSLAVLGSATSLERVAIVVAGFVVAGMLLSLTVAPARPADEAPTTIDGEAPTIDAEAPSAAIDGVVSGLEPARRRLGVAYRRSWTIPLAVILTYVAHWGAVTAYLPARAETAGADIGLFFAADGVAIMAMRIPTGWLADRIRSRWLILGGLAMGVVAVALLIPPATTPLLVASGLIGGAGGGLVLTPILVELSRRSDERDRGSAFSLFSGALAGAITLGSIGGAPLIAVAGFEATMVAGLVLIVVAAGISLVDRGFAADPRPRATAGRAGAS